MEMVPLIDMFFLLLVFFIFGVFAMRMQEGLMVELPSAQTAAGDLDEPVTVSVSAEGALWLNQQPVTADDLPARLREMPTAAVLAIQADRRAAHGVVMSVLDAARQAGRIQVSFQTEPESK